MGEEDLTHGKREGAKAAGRSTRSVQQQRQQQRSSSSLVRLPFVREVAASGGTGEVIMSISVLSKDSDEREVGVSHQCGDRVLYALRRASTYLLIEW